ncbi:MAG: hypothetical protein B7Z80_21985 [Rhodospirillales bacterium 20-64-7]|nr:MAG: hypothetical protein B7Z80_21985 [Rhodospirillales bacterium 20-64-7]
MSLWLDVDDLIRYFSTSVRPTGIQRLSFELFRQLHQNADAPGGIIFCRRLVSPPYFQRVTFAALETELLALSQAPAPLALPLVRQRPTGWLADRARRLPHRIRRNLQTIIYALRDIRWALRDLIRVFRGRAGDSHMRLLSLGQFDDPHPAVGFAPGDWLVNLGSSWNAPYQPAALDSLHRLGGRFAILVHDLIPQLFPEWSTQATLQEYRLWLHDTLPCADLLLANSRNTAADIQICLSRAHGVLPPIAILPMGGLPQSGGVLQPVQPFVLLVSTLEVRKNHALMFKVWQRLLAHSPEFHVPDLVFAGKRGWLIDDFLSQLDNAGWLDGKIRFIESPSDAELATLYRQCLFTVYPSFYEGWGLPVTESLNFGKTVAASNRASIPEAGGDFCVYFDPENIAEATSVIAGLIMQPERVAALEAHIEAHFQPPTWAQSAATLVDLLTDSAKAAALAPQPAIRYAA